MSNSAAPELSLTRIGPRIRGTQPSAARGETAECVAEQLYAGNGLRRVLLAYCDVLRERASAGSAETISTARSRHQSARLAAELSLGAPARVRYQTVVEPTVGRRTKR